MVVVVLVVVVIVDVVFDVLVVLNVDIVVQATSKVNLMLHSIEVEFPVGWGGMNSNTRVKPNSVELS